MIRRFFVWMHRWTGLAMSAFLILVGLTGSVLAFRPQIEHLLAPQYYAHPEPGSPRLDFRTLTDRAEALVPEEQVYWICSFPDQIRIAFSPRKNVATGKPYPHNVEFLFLNPWTGQELARQAHGAPDPHALVYTLIYLHEALCLGNAGLTFMGIIALIWAIDCFVGFYLTLPASIERFWPRWQQAWLVKWRASAARVNFDLHRAGGLWLWPLLFVFAWSGVMMNIPKFYHQVSDPVFKYVEPDPDSYSVAAPDAAHPPQIDFRTALSIGQRLMHEQGTTHGFTAGQPEVVMYEPEHRQYFYSAKTSRDVFDRDSGTGTSILFNSETGALRSLTLPTGEHIGNTVSTWLLGLHEVWVFGLPYHIFVCVLGLVITLLSYTGIYIWWRKRRTRVLATTKARVVPASSPSYPHRLGDERMNFRDQIARDLKQTEVS